MTDKSQTTEILELTKQIDRLCSILEKGIQVRNDSFSPIPNSIRLIKDEPLNGVWGGPGGAIG